MKRLSDSSQYGNEYMPNEVLQDLFDGIFVPREIPNTFKMNLQSAYVDGLIRLWMIVDMTRYRDLQYLIH